MSHHRRRYSPALLRNRLREAGYRVEYLTQYMVGILPLVWLARRIGDLRRRIFPGRSDARARELRVPRWGNDLLCSLLKRESSVVARGRTLPLGTSLLAVARPAAA
jgi:hypothetical protein